MQLGNCSGSILPQPSENKDRVNKLAQLFGVHKEVDDIYYCNMVGYRLHGYTIIRAKVLAWGTTPIMGSLPRS